MAYAANNQSGAGRHHRSPREMLDERYARGEIGKDEYDQVCRDLETR